MAKHLLLIDYVQNVPERRRGRHRHDFDEAIAVRAGTYRLRVAGEDLIASPGQLVHIPAGQEHEPLLDAGGGTRFLLCQWQASDQSLLAAAVCADGQGRLGLLLDWLWTLQPDVKGGDRRHARRVFELFVAELRRQRGTAQVPHSNSQVKRVRCYLEQNLHRAVNLAEVAHSVGWSREHLIRRFGAEVGLTPNRYLQDLRVRKAAALLQSTQDDLATIADRVGLRSAPHLHKLITRALGRTPGAIRDAPLVGDHLVLSSAAGRIPGVCRCCRGPHTPPRGQ